MLFGKVLYGNMDYMGNFSLLKFTSLFLVDSYGVCYKLYSSPSYQLLKKSWQPLTYIFFPQFSATQSKTFPTSPSPPPAHEETCEAQPVAER
jgi:hypothetical protein